VKATLNNWLIGVVAVAVVSVGIVHSWRGGDTNAAAQQTRAMPRSTYLGKAKYANGTLELPDGRSIHLPPEVVRKIPPGVKESEFSEITTEAGNEGAREVAAAAEEMIAEEVTKKKAQEHLVNPELLKGRVLRK
jgi:hypothetical protein